MICFFLFTVPCIAPVFAQGNLTWGKFKGKVGLEYQLEFNDNIFSEAVNEQDDIIHHIIPMIELGYENEGRPGNYFFIGYKVSFTGSIIGFLYGFAVGTICGSLTGWLYNRIVTLRRKL